MFLKSRTSPSAAVLMATGAKHTPFSIIGGDVAIHGDIEASVDLHIDGKVDGDISCAALVQGPESRIKGHVTARSARIGGYIEGSITAEELIIEAGARISGDVSYQSISIAIGGQVDGQMSHMAAAADLKLVGSDAG